MRTCTWTALYAIQLEGEPVKPVKFQPFTRKRVSLHRDIAPISAQLQVASSFPLTPEYAPIYVTIGPELWLTSDGSKLLYSTGTALGAFKVDTYFIIIFYLMG